MNNGQGWLLPCGTAAVVDLGGWLGGCSPPSCHLRKHKRMYALTLKHNKTAKLLHLLPFLHFKNTTA